MLETLRRSKLWCARRAYNLGQNSVGESPYLNQRLRMYPIIKQTKGNLGGVFSELIVKHLRREKNGVAMNSRNLQNEFMLWCGVIVS